jgi:hypothetical protein
MNHVRSRRARKRTYSASCTNRKVRPLCDILDEVHLLLISLFVTEGDRIAKYNLRLMNNGPDLDAIDIPPDDRRTCVTMSSREFARIVGDLCSIGESIRIDLSNPGGLLFVGYGEALHGNIVLNQTDDARERYKDYGKEDEVDEMMQDAMGTSTSTLTSVRFFYRSTVHTLEA